jgi:LacI family transcriptional regulator
MPQGDEIPELIAPSRPRRPVSLKTLALHLNLSTTTVSLVLNNSPRSRSIPASTKERILSAAKELDYTPNYFARYLNTKRANMAAVIVPEVSEGYGSSVMGGIERCLVRSHFAYLAASHRWSPELIENTPRMLMDRGAEGFILVNMPLTHSLPLPVVNVGGHERLPSVTNIRLDNHRAAWLAIEHLHQLGHRRIAFFKGHPCSVDTEERWEGILSACQHFGLPVLPELTVQMTRHGNPPAAPVPGDGYVDTQALLARRVEFTALFTFNDIAAIGALASFRDAGLRVPEDVSLVGFDDIQAAGYLNPTLTTVRQPLQKMGEMAARELLRRLDTRDTQPAEIIVQPELVVRKSTAAARKV